MGQRTQILVVRENNNGERKSRFYHLQWGYGRIMYMAVMDAVMSDYNKITFRNGYSFLNRNEFTTNPCLAEDESCPKLDEALSKVDVENLDTIRYVFYHGDNNNGGCVIYLKEDAQKYGRAKIKIGFLLGGEDETSKEKAFARWLTPAEYGKMNGGSDFSNKEFIDMFESFCKYFDVEYFANK